MKLTIPEGVKEYYTDILAHSYEPEGTRIAAGTTFGRIIVLERDGEKNEAFARMETELPNDMAVLGLHWGLPGMFVCSKSLLYLYRLKDQDEVFMDVDNNETSGSEELPSLVKNLVKFDCMFEVQDVTCRPSGRVVFGACEDCKVRAWDVETQKVVGEFSDHKTPVEVCNANEEFVVSGGQDGKIYVYDGQLRSSKHVALFEQGKSTITGVDISDSSTWIAGGSAGSPQVYNMKNAAALPRIPMKTEEKIYTIHFDSENTLWWGGGGCQLHKSTDLTNLSSTMESRYGEARINHVYSITTTGSSVGSKLSAAGSSTGILFSENSEYWDGMVHI